MNLFTLTTFLSSEGKLEQCIKNYSKSKVMIKNAKKKINRFYYKSTCPNYLNYLEKINLS